MRKVLSWLLCLLFFSSMSGALAEEMIILDEAEAVVLDATELDEVALEPMEVDVGVQYGTKLTVGALTMPSGAFSTDMWGNNTVDLDVRALLHAYDTVMLTQKQGLVINENVLKDVQIGYRDNGEAVYVLTFSDQLKYNDGTPVTAKDYAFSILLSGAPEIEAIGGTTQGRSHLKGYTEYMTGQTNSISGVRLVSDYDLVVYIDGDYLPYFYGHAMISMKPLPISEIAPGCEVRDDGEGIYIATADDAVNINAEGLPYTPGVFSTEMLQETMLNEENGYLSHPRKTTGPYSLVEYDASENRATFVINEEYIGNYEGEKPHIETLEFRTVEEATMVDDLLSGRVDLLNKMTETTLIQQIMQGQTPERGIAQGSYLRTGLAFYAFACEQEPTSSVAVRKAIAMSIDKDALIAKNMDGAALKVNGYYGLGQWMASYSDVDDPELEGEPINIPEMLDTLEMPIDINGANKLLAEDGWSYDETGGRYASGEGMYRYRKTESGYEPLFIRLAVTEDNEAADDAAEIMQEVCAQLGVQLEVAKMPFAQLLKHYYRQEERTYDMFFLASNFNYIFDPYYDFNTADEYQGMLNTSGLRDEELMERAFALRYTSPGETREYIEKWLDFQDRFVEMMPLIPLYSNVYFDFYVDTLQNYDMALHSSWSNAVLYAYFGEAAPTTDSDMEFEVVEP